MKTPRRLITVALGLAVVACALFLTLHSFAQSGGVIHLPPDGQKLIAPYDKNGDRWENEILKHHSTKYCVRHKKTSSDTPVPHPPGCTVATGSTSDASQSLPISVGRSAAPVPMQDKPTGINVTQQISYASQADYDAIVATFARTP